MLCILGNGLKRVYSAPSPPKQIFKIYILLNMNLNVTVSNCGMQGYLAPLVYIEGKKAMSIGIMNRDVLRMSVIMTL